jgi:hypothetical protein
MPISLWARCDSPGCESFRLTPVGQPPQDWLTINNQVFVCSWTCLALYAAQAASQLEKPPENGTVPDAEPEKAAVDASSPS